MKTKQLFKKVLSLLIVSVMLIGVATPAINATNFIEHLHKNNAGEGKLHYVSLGASNTNGYGHHGYLDPEIYEDPLAAPKANMNDYGYDKAPANAYPALIRDALAEKTGREVELHQLAISSMRVEEVLWLLDDSCAPDEYMDWRFTGGKSWFDMAHKEGGRDALRVEYRDYIANADVITVDLGWNNFGVYAFNNIMTILKEHGTRYWKAPDFDSVIDAGMEEEYYAIRDKVIERINDFVDLSDTALTGNTIEMLADVLTYATFGACYNFDKVIEKIYDLNPDANVVVINIQNLADELIVNLDGTELPLGDLYGELIEFVDLYRASMSPYADKYGFAYAGVDGDVDTFLDEFRLWNGDPATLSQDMKDLFDMYDDNLYVRSKIEYMMVGQALGAVFKNLRDMGAYYGLSVFADDENYVYDFALDMSWIDGVDLASLDFNNPDTPLEEYGAAVSKHLVNLRNYESFGKDAYNYIFANLTTLLTTQKTQVETQMGIAQAMKDGLVAQRDTLLEKKAEKEEELELEVDPGSQDAIRDAIAQFESLIVQCNDGIAQYEQGIAEAAAGIAQLEAAITTIIPVAKQGFDNALAGIYATYINTLSYAYDTVGTIVQYTLQFNTFYMTPDSMANHNNKTDELLTYLINTFTNNTMLKFYEELGKIGMDSSGAVAPEITVNEDIFKDLGIQAACALEVRYDFGNSFFAHPSVKGNQQIKDAVMDVLENGSHADAFEEKKIEGYINFIEDMLNPYYEEKYAELKANGTIDKLLEGLDTFDTALDAMENGVIAFEIPADVDVQRAENLRVLLLEEIANTRVTSAGLRALLGVEALEFTRNDYAKLVELQHHLADHIDTIGRIAVELGYFADFYLAELEEIIVYQAGILTDMAEDSYDYLVSEVEKFNDKYLELVEEIGSYADKIDLELGAAVRKYLIEAPEDAIEIICTYGEDALIKLMVDAASVTNNIGASIGVIATILADHGEDIYNEIKEDPEYKDLMAAIELKDAELRELYRQANEHPIVTAIDLDKRIAKEVKEITALYERLVALVIKNVEAYDSEVAEILKDSMADLILEFGIIGEAGEEYLVWLQSNTNAMFGALLHSFLDNTEELGRITDKVIWKYINKFAKLAQEAIRAYVEEKIAYLEAKFEELEGLANEYKYVVAFELLTMVGEVYELALEKLDDAIRGEYTPDEDSFFVAITGDNGEYAELLAGALGLSDNHSVMVWSEIDKSILYSADFVTLGYDRAQIERFAINQFLASVAAYGNDSLRAQVAEYLKVALADDFDDEGLAEFSANIDDAIVSVLDNPAFAGKTVENIDWAELLGEENVEWIDELLTEVAIALEEKGIVGDYVVSVNVAELLDKYLPDVGATIDIFDSHPVFELTIPAADMLMIAVESYIYATVKFHIDYAELIMDLTEANPDVQIAVLGQYNPFEDITVAGVIVPMADIYDRFVAIANINSFVYALALPNVTYVDISDAETAWDSITDPMALLEAYVNNPESALFTDATNLYVMNQILAAYGLECKHLYDGCTDVDCNICGAIRENAEHTYESVVTKPDCENGGYTTHTCTVCGDTYVDNRTDALGHTYDHACDVDCNRCGEQRTPVDHEFGDWTVVLEPTTDAEGREERTCAICGHVESRFINKLEETDLSTAAILGIVFGSAVITFGIGAAVLLIIKRRKGSN